MSSSGPIHGPSGPLLQHQHGYTASTMSLAGNQERGVSSSLSAAALAAAAAASHRRGPWSPGEDQTLLDLVSVSGSQLNWVHIASTLGTRTAKQCRERFHQNLKPSLNLTPITPEEGQRIEELVRELGHRWAEIARRLDNRSDNAVKNYWNGGKGRRKRHHHPSQQHGSSSRGSSSAGQANTAQPGVGSRDPCISPTSSSPATSRPQSSHDYHQQHYHQHHYRRPVPEQLRLPVPRLPLPGAVSPTATTSSTSTHSTATYQLHPHHHNHHDHHHHPSHNHYGYAESPLPSPTGPPPSLYSDASSASSSSSASAAASYESSPSTTLTTPRTGVPVLSAALATMSPFFKLPEQPSSAAKAPLVGSYGEPQLQHASPPLLPLGHRHPHQQEHYYRPEHRHPSPPRRRAEDGPTLPPILGSNISRPSSRAFLGTVLN